MNSNVSQPNLHVKYANFKSLHPHCHKLGATNYAYKTNVSVYSVDRVCHTCCLTI